MKLGVNIDHIAVLREARQVNDPDILAAMFSACGAGADQITIHLREDRRHINDSDAANIINLAKIPVNLECASSDEIIDIACRLRPNRATLVPEKRAELTTEGGLNLLDPTTQKSTANAIKKLQNAAITTSLFIDPDPQAIKVAKGLGAAAIELHTGAYANFFLMLNSNLSRTKYAVSGLQNLGIMELETGLKNELERLQNAAKMAKQMGLEVAAGHGLNYQNVSPIAKIDEIFELNIGQSIVARSVFVGLDAAIKEMKNAIKNATKNARSE